MLFVSCGGLYQILLFFLGVCLYLLAQFLFFFFFLGVGRRHDEDGGRGGRRRNSFLSLIYFQHIINHEVWSTYLQHSLWASLPLLPRFPLNIMWSQTPRYQEEPHTLTSKFVSNLWLETHLIKLYRVWILFFSTPQLWISWHCYFMLPLSVVWQINCALSKRAQNMIWEGCFTL